MKPSTAWKDLGELLAQERRRRGSESAFDEPAAALGLFCSLVRNAAGLRQRQAAEAARLSAPAASRLESGANGIPDLQTLRRYLVEGCGAGLLLVAKVGEETVTYDPASQEVRGSWEAVESAPPVAGAGAGGAGIPGRRAAAPRGQEA